MSTAVMIDQVERTREARLRRRASRQGLLLAKSRCRTPEAHVFGTYALLDQYNNLVAYAGGDGYGLTLDEIEKALNE
jgi:hypothetical protein